MREFEEPAQDLKTLYEQRDATEHLAFRPFFPFCEHANVMEDTQPCNEL
jgi:hypothetical protein